MNNKLGLSIIWFLISLTAWSVSAQTLEQTSKVVFSQVEHQLALLRVSQQLSKQNVKSLVETMIVPHLDKKYFTYKVLGKHLKTISNQDRAEFVTIFTDKIIRNYINALEKYDGERFIHGEVRYAQSGKVATTLIKITKNNTNLDIQTKWRYAEDTQQWLMYDIVVAGVSLLQTKQKEMAHQLVNNQVAIVLAKLKLS